MLRPQHVRVWRHARPSPSTLLTLTPVKVMLEIARRTLSQLDAVVAFVGRTAAGPGPLDVEVGDRVVAVVGHLDDGLSRARAAAVAFLLEGGAVAVDHVAFDTLEGEGRRRRLREPGSTRGGKPIEAARRLGLDPTAQRGRHVAATGGVDARRWYLAGADDSADQQVGCPRCGCQSDLAQRRSHLAATGRLPRVTPVTTDRARPAPVPTAEHGGETTGAGTELARSYRRHRRDA